MNDISALFISFLGFFATVGIYGFVLAPIEISDACKWFVNLILITIVCIPPFECLFRLGLGVRL